LRRLDQAGALVFHISIRVSAAAVRSVGAGVRRRQPQHRWPSWFPPSCLGDHNKASDNRASGKPPDVQRHPYQAERASEHEPDAKPCRLLSADVVVSPPFLAAHGSRCPVTYQATASVMSHAMALPYCYKFCAVVAHCHGDGRTTPAR
jgi:hypothetical protein